MAELKVWEKRVSQVLDHDDPEEEELADHFNKAFARLLKVVPKADRRALIDMIYAAGELYRKHGIETFIFGNREGCKRGRKDGIRYTLDRVNEQLKEIGIEFHT